MPQAHALKVNADFGSRHRWPGVAEVIHPPARAQPDTCRHPSPKEVQVNEGPWTPVFLVACNSCVELG